MGSLLNWVIRAFACDPSVIPADEPDMLVGDWMETASGRKFYPLSPRKEDVDLEDIAHHLARTSRYNGAYRLEHYSVAEHSVLISQWLLRTYNDPFLAYQGLFHDAPEAYIGDMVRPLKKQPEMRSFRQAEDRIWEAIVDKSGILSYKGYALDPRVKEADSRIIVDERRQVMRKSGNTWGSDELEPLGVEIKGLGAWQAQEWFISQEAYLFRDCVTALSGS